MAGIIPHVAHPRKENLLDPSRILQWTLPYNRITHPHLHFHNLLGHPSCFNITQGYPRICRFFLNLNFVDQYKFLCPSNHMPTPPFGLLWICDAQITRVSPHPNLSCLIRRVENTKEREPPPHIIWEVSAWNRNLIDGWRRIPKSLYYLYILNICYKYKVDTYNNIYIICIMHLMGRFIATESNPIHIFSAPPSLPCEGFRVPNPPRNCHRSGRVGFSCGH